MILQQTNKQQEKQLSMTTVNMPIAEYTEMTYKVKEYNNHRNKIAKLEADLKEKIDNDRKRMALMSSDRQEIRELKKQNEQLEEENEIFKQFALDVHNFAFSTNMDDLDIVSAMDLGSVVEELNKDEDKMYKDIEELKKEIERRDEIIQNHIKELTFQKECRETENKEIAELKKQNEIFTRKLDNLPNDMDIFYWDEKRDMWRHDEDEVSDEEDEVNVKGTITLTSDTEPYEEMIIRFNNMITKEQYEDEDFMDNIDDKLNLLSGFPTNGYDIQIDFE